jgi:hypothetical protein
MHDEIENLSLVGIPAIDIARTLHKKGWGIEQARITLLRLGHTAEINPTRPPELHVGGKERVDARTLPSVRWV